MTLEDYLDTNCRWLEMTVKTAPPGGDLPPFFGYVADGTMGAVAHDIPIDDKSLVAVVFAKFLQAIGAEQYVVILPAWHVPVQSPEVEAASKIINREGTGGQYAERRRECYHVTVGDRERSLVAFLNTIRDGAGKITALERVPFPPSNSFGRFSDLLEQARQ